MAEDGFSNRSQRPLAGIVLCCTSILPERRTELSAIAMQMGAEHQLDLTSDVTHLLVGDINTPKYKYVAKEREDVKVLNPDWVEAVRESWMEGGDTDVEALEREYKLPTFDGLSICLTGFDDLIHRTQIQNNIINNGGHYTGDLTKSVSHLIARVPEGKKYVYAGQWNIKVVSLKWFTESLSRGMTLEETLYHPTTPEAEQGLGAWIRLSPSASLLGKRTRGAEPVVNPVRTKLRRTASSKLGSQNEGLWTDIVGGGFSIQPQAIKQWDDDDEAMKPPVRPKSMVLEPKSFASDTTVMEWTESIGTIKNQHTPPDSSAASKGFLHGRTFFIYGFTDRQISILESHLSANDGDVVLNMMDLPQKGIVKDTSYILIPHHLVKDDIPSTRDLNKPPVIVTEMWLERCLHSKAFESPDVHVTNTPFPAFPIPDFEELKICSTGFPGIELLHLAKVVKLMGGIYDEDLTSKTSIMICNAKDSRKEKLRHAYEWSIPAVSAEWLWDSIRRTRKMPLETYRIATPQYIIDEAKASREEREKSRDKRSNHDRIEKEHIPHMKDAGISKGKHRTNAESGRSKRPGCPAISKKTVKKGELREVEPTLPIDPEPLPINSNSARTSTSTSSEALVPTLPLREISTNSPPKYPATLSPSPPKEALHAQEPPGQLEEDVAQEPPIASAATINTPITQPTPPSTTETDTTTIRKHVSLNTTLSNLLSRKKPKPTAPTNPSAPPPRRRHLLGRANSSSSINPNLKPTTPLPVATFAAPPTTAKPKPLSRATSISSVNSDGLGSVIPTQSQPESQLQSLSTFCKGPEPTSNTDATISAAAQILQWQRNEGLPAHLRPDATGGQVDAAGEGDGVVLTQLGYENASSGGTEKQGVKKGGKVRDIEGFTSIGAAGKSRRSRGRRDP